MEKIRILIADDVEIIAKQTKMYLENREDVEVVGIASNGKEEIDLIKELKPDLVFTDNQMPQMNGIEVIESVYNSDIEKKPKFIFVTGDRDMALFERANKCGVVKILNKPVDDNKIIEAFEYYKELPEEELIKEDMEEKQEETKVSFVDKIKRIFNG